VFGEALTFGRLLETSPTPRHAPCAACRNIEGAIATVFRQVAMNSFERLVAHRAPRGRRAVGGPLRRAVGADPDGAARRRRRGDRRLPLLVSYIPHFINTPGYVYAYSYGQLLALSSMTATSPRLGLRGSLSRAAAQRRLTQPEELGEIVGIDLADPGFWERGLDLVQRNLEAAEAAAQAL